MGATSFIGDWGNNGDYATGPLEFHKGQEVVYISWFDGYCHRHPSCYYGKYLIFTGHLANRSTGEIIYASCNKCGAVHTIVIKEKALDGYTLHISLAADADNGYTNPVAV